MDQPKFIHFQKHVEGQQKLCDMIVYADPNEIFHFFGNALFYCLGYERPHIALKTIPLADQTKESYGHGIYLNESVAQEAIERKVQQDPSYTDFLVSFKAYIDNCRGNVLPVTLCPQPTT